MNMTDNLQSKDLPPQWPEDKINERLKTIRSHCEDISIIEIDNINDIPENMLTEEEACRLTMMGEKRRKSYLAARIACKYLVKKLAGGNASFPLDMINTITRDKPYPRCPMPDGSNPYFCSVSHDSMYAVATASKNRIGIDVEEISERVLKALNRFMDKREISIAKESPLSEVQAVLRVWSIKESATKALRITMYKTWKETHVIEIGNNSSKLILNDKIYTAYHDTAGEHLFTILELA